MISVIVPVYKTEQYLNKCVESILNQTYKDLEILL
ncbi:MAG: glycosyltransferase, partial [Clostridia bacterium]|nr:glycosyltransferase [Clostridia bacterium]